MKLHKYTLEQLLEAVKTSKSYRQVLVQLNVVPAGGNYQTLKKAINYYDLDISHFTGRAWNKGRTFAPHRPLSDYLDNKQPIQSYKLKKRLFKEGLFIIKCERCENTRWENEIIPLELHHLDGDTKNNNLDNIQMLCPNCHALTDNYRAKNVSS